MKLMLNENGITLLTLEIVYEHFIGGRFNFDTCDFNYYFYLFEIFNLLNKYQNTFESSSEINAFSHFYYVKTNTP